MKTNRELQFPLFENEHYSIEATDDPEVRRYVGKTRLLFVDDKPDDNAADSDEDDHDPARDIGDATKGRRSQLTDPHFRPAPMLEVVLRLPGVEAAELRNTHRSPCSGPTSSILFIRKSPVHPWAEVEAGIRALLDHLGPTAALMQAFAHEEWLRTAPARAVKMAEEEAERDARYKELRKRENVQKRRLELERKARAEAERSSGI